MGSGKRILIVSGDIRALQTRKLILGAYFDVYAAGRVGEAVRYLSEQSFHLIVLCYSLSGEHCQKILRAAQQRSAEAAVLMITLNNQVSDGAAGAVHVALDDGPLCLLRRSAEILGFEFRSRGRLINALHPRSNPEVPVQRYT